MRGKKEEKKACQTPRLTSQNRRLHFKPPLQCLQRIEQTDSSRNKTKNNKQQQQRQKQKPEHQSHRI
jgi:hypothetical protein